MSFICKACGRQRAGSTTKGQEVCAECQPTQAGQAVLLLAEFERCRVNGMHIQSLDVIVGHAQNGPPLGDGDDSIHPDQWAKLRDLVKAARAYNEALDAAAPWSRP